MAALIAMHKNTHMLWSKCFRKVHKNCRINTNQCCASYSCASTATVCIDATSCPVHRQFFWCPHASGPGQFLISKFTCSPIMWVRTAPDDTVFFGWQRSRSAPVEVDGWTLADLPQSGRHWPPRKNIQKEHQQVVLALHDLSLIYFDNSKK